MTKIIQLALGPIQTNCYIVGCEESGQAAVIDPSFDGALIARKLEENQLVLTHILITHAHFDHVGGLGELKALFPEAPIYIHPDAVEMLKIAPTQARLYGLDFPPSPPADLDLAVGDIIEVGTLSFEVLYTPGHAPGHVSFYLRQAGALFSGDVLFQGSIGRTDLPGGNFNQLIEVIHSHLMALPDETIVYSGHGPATTIGQEKRQNPFLQ